MRDFILNLHRKLDVFIRSAQWLPDLTNRDVAKFENDLEKYYALQPDWPNQSIDEVFQHIKNVARHNHFVAIKDSSDPLKIRIGLKSFDELEPLIIRNFYIQIVIGENRAGSKIPKFHISLVRRDSH